MDSSLTKLELDAVLQLIQLSTAAATSSSDARDIRVVCVDFPAGKEEEVISSNKGEEEGSVGDALSSSVIINPDNCDEAEAEAEEEEEALPRIKPRYASLLDVYSRRRPPTGDGGGKRARF